MSVVSDYTALLSGSTWNGDDASGRPTFLTFSFETSPAGYLTELYTPAFLASFQAFTPAEQAMARDALQQWANASGLVLFEVPSGQGDIRFGSYNFAVGPEDHRDAAAFASYPAVFVSETYAEVWQPGGDVFVDIGWADFETLAHEIGHALGLKHPFDDDDGRPTLNPAIDDAAHTVMTYNFSAFTTLGSLDLEAIRYLYGTQAQDGSQVASWSWNATSYVLTQAGGTASDTIMGVGVADIMSGGAGDDQLVGGAGGDRLDGGADNDVVNGGAGADTIDGGAGDDILWGDEDADRLTGAGGSDTMLGGSGNDQVDGDDGDDDLYGGEGNDRVDGGAGDDSVDGGTGFDTLAGGLGDDVLYTWSRSVVADGGAGDDALVVVSPIGESFNFNFLELSAGGGSLTSIETIVYFGDVLSDTMVGGALVDALIGDAGADSLSGGLNGDLLFGDGGADTLSGGVGDDYLEGGTGDDVLIAGAGADEMDGGGGIDTADFTGETEALSLTINAPRQVTGGTETMVGVENVIGTGLADTITGDAAGNRLYGRLGNDTVAGGGGANFLRGEEGNDSIVGGADFDDASGNMGDDTVAGGAGDDWVVGGKDQDRLFGEDGDDIVLGNLGADTCDGGAGADIIRGGQQDDVLTGGAGNDWLSGDRNNDTLTGGAGADIFHSFSLAGIDRVLDFSLAEGDRIQLDAGTTYTLRQVGADAVVDMGAGNEVILVGVSMSSLTASTIFFGPA